MPVVSFATDFRGRTLEQVTDIDKSARSFQNAVPVFAEPLADTRQANELFVPWPLEPLLCYFNANIRRGHSPASE